MNSEEKEISFNCTKTYSTLNRLTSETETIWFVCHGMGYLSRYFLKYFKGLDQNTNYLIAPQAPSKYYMAPSFKHVGASWLTRENTVRETENIMQYFDSIFEAEPIPSEKRFVILGYSQGVSVAMRYVASRKIQCDQLVLMSGGIPKELKAQDFDHLNCRVVQTFGIHDEYLDEDRIQYETNRIKELFGSRAEIIPFDGQHWEEHYPDGRASGYRNYPEE